MELAHLTNISDITYMSELTLDIFDVKGQIRTNKVAIQRRILDMADVKDVLI